MTFRHQARCHDCQSVFEIPVEYELEPPHFVAQGQGTYDTLHTRCERCGSQNFTFLIVEDAHAPWESDPDAWKRDTP